MSRVEWAMGLQGAYYLLTGVWPLIHLSSFEAVTGPKVDHWLVHMVGLLAVAVGVALVLAALRGETRTLTAASLAVGTAFAFAAIDTRYALSGRISAIYLADAAVELGWIILFGLTLPRPRSPG